MPAVDPGVAMAVAGVFAQTRALALGGTALVALGALAAYMASARGGRN